MTAAAAGWLWEMPQPSRAAGAREDGALEAGATMTDERQDTDVEIQDFILSRELAEVYLLMDHISACERKEIPASINGDAIFQEPGGKTWLEQICEIAWPPEASTRAQDARNAAKLIRAKDVLNKAAAPATGGSIAFTLMVAGEARDPQSGSWWRRTLLWMADVRPTDPAETGGAGGGGESGGSGPGWPGGKPPSRASLAALAYPSLARRAWRYRLGLYFILVFLVLWLLVTCVLSWDVATGNSLLNRVTALDTRVATLQSAADSSAAGQGQPEQQSGGDAQSAPEQSGAVERQAEAQPKPGDSTPTSELNRTAQLRDVALDNLGDWMNGATVIRGLLIERMGGTDEATTVAAPAPAAPAPEATPTPEAMPGKTNSEWAAVLLGILASNILPIFYGLLGAGAAVVRQVSQKMRDSVLAPRDILLAYVQLALGAVIGACIGLFVNSEGDAATEGGLLGSVPLSASALCFVAGFGVEGVFQALESLIRRVFNLDSTRPAPAV